MIYGLNDQQEAEEAELLESDGWDEAWYNRNYRDKTAEEVILGELPQRGQASSECPCMHTQDHLGQIVCKRCRGDFYACECPLVHSILCREHPDNRCDFCHKGMKSSEATFLCIQCKEDGVGQHG